MDQIPAGFDSDEAEFAFNAYSLSRYLKNENNELLPYQVNTYGNYRPLGLPYLIAGSLKIFGNSIFAVRLPNALIGAFSTFLLIIFISWVFKSEKTGILAGWFLAWNPWHVFLSRATAEPVLAMFFLLLLFILILKYWQQPRIKFLFFIYSVAFISLFTYTGVLPLIFLLSGCLTLFLFLQTKKLHWQLIIPFILLIVFPILPIYKTNPGYFNGRFNQTSILKGQGALGINLLVAEKIRENAHNRSFQNSITQFFHNNLNTTVNTVLTNLLEHFSTKFLYFQGGLPKRLQVPDVGVFIFIEMFFFLGGVLLVFQKRKYYLFLLGIVLIIISFLPAGLTVEEIPSTHRTIFAVIGFLLFESYFVFNFSHILRAYPFFFAILVAVFFFELSSYLHNYLVLQSRHNNLFRWSEMQDVARYIYKNKDKYDQIYVVKHGTEPAYFYYFFNKLEPLSLILNKNKNHSSSWQDGNIHYLHMPCADIQPIGKKNLIIEEAAFCQGSGNFLRTIYNSDGSAILRIIEK